MSPQHQRVLEYLQADMQQLRCRSAVAAHKLRAAAANPAGSTCVSLLPLADTLNDTRTCIIDGPGLQPSAVVMAMKSGKRPVMDCSLEISLQEGLASDSPTLPFCAAFAAIPPQTLGATCCLGGLRGLASVMSCIPDDVT
eukprot:355524-Chlamydomonas_euryale.AAC.17